jgi:hypothetical protein
MKLRKLAEEPEPKTILAQHAARFNAAMEKAEQTARRSTERILALERKRRELGEEAAKIEAQVEKLRGEYRGILEGVKLQVEESVRREAVTAKDLESGAATIRQFMAVGKQEAEVQAEVSTGAQDRLRVPLEAIRKLTLRLFEVRAGIAEVDENIIHEQHRATDGLAVFLEGFQRSLTAPRGFVVQWAREQARDRRYDAMAAEGTALKAVKWDVKTLLEAEELRFDPRLKAEHFDAFEKSVLRQLRGREFVRAVIVYSQNELTGRGAGDFNVQVFESPLQKEAR